MFEILVFKTKRDGAFYYKTGNECAVLHRGKYKKLNEAYLAAVAWLQDLTKEASVIIRQIDEDDL